MRSEAAALWLDTLTDTKSNPIDTPNNLYHLQAIQHTHKPYNSQGIKIN